MKKTALITGTTSGIGKAFSEKLAREGYDLILVSRDERRLSEQAQKLSSENGIIAHYIPVDLLENGAAQKVFDTVKKMGLSVQVLINNAGFNECGVFFVSYLQKEIDMISLHAICTTEMTKMFLPDMVKNKYGRILNLGSTGSFMACPNNAVYAATKAYILYFSKGINAELKGTGVSATTLCPGATNTEFPHKAGIERTLLFNLFVMTPEKVAKIGFNALIKKKAYVIAGLYNKILVLSSKLMPAFILNASIKMMFKKSRG
jgi:short-subunit dehydrogenase